MRKKMTCLGGASAAPKVAVSESDSAACKKTIFGAENLGVRFFCLVGFGSGVLGMGKKKGSGKKGKKKGKEGGKDDAAKQLAIKAALIQAKLTSNVASLKGRLRATIST
jgi:hypothetical protein